MDLECVSQLTRYTGTNEHAIEPKADTQNRSLMKMHLRTSISKTKRRPTRKQRTYAKRWRSALDVRQHSLLASFWADTRLVPLKTISAAIVMRPNPPLDRAKPFKYCKALSRVSGRAWPADQVVGPSPNGQRIVEGVSVSQEDRTLGLRDQQDGEMTPL